MKSIVAKNFIPNLVLGPAGYTGDPIAIRLSLTGKVTPFVSRTLLKFFLCASRLGSRLLSFLRSPSWLGSVEWLKAAAALEREKRLRGVWQVIIKTELIVKSFNGAQPTP